MSEYNHNKSPLFLKKQESKKKDKPAQRAPLQRRKSPDTSWEKVDTWYDQIVGEKGHYYHQYIVIPRSIRLLNLQANSSLLDLACGQGVLSRSIPQSVRYVGIDKARGLINQAKKYPAFPTCSFLVCDITNPLPLDQNVHFTHATLILALQNIQDPLAALKNASKYLKRNGVLLIVLNHPCYRIPRHSHWGTDDKSHVQYRRLDTYMSHMAIPIQAAPSQGALSETTWSFHFPLSSLMKWLKEADLVIETLEEWCSDKVSSGGAAKRENRARKEFPLFLAVLARKI